MNNLPLSPDTHIHVSDTPEGMEVRFLGHACSLQDAYVIMSDMSRKHDGRPVAFRGFLPGVDLHVQSRWQEADGIDMLRMYWQSTQYLLDRLIESNPPETMLSITSPIVIATVSRASSLDLPTTVLQLRWL